MSFDPKYLTGGGQVIFMRLKMFLQINNLISYYLLMGFGLLVTGVFFFRLSIQTIMNGIIYWYVNTVYSVHDIFIKNAQFNITYYGQRLTYSPEQVLNDPYTVFCGQQVKQTLMLALAVGVIFVFVAGLAAYWYIGRSGKKQSEDEIIGGRILSEDPSEVTRMMRKNKDASDIMIDQLALKKDAEIQNFAMHGTVGSGKSTLMRKLLIQLRERGDLVIIYDKGCTFVEDFYDESRDKILNALDKRCPNWDLWDECQTLPELENVSTTMIPSSAGEDPFWQGSARTIFSEGTERMRGDKNRSYNALLRTLLAIKLDQLRDFLTGTPASTLVDGKIEKTAISIRSVLTNYVKALRYLQGIDKPGRPRFTIKEWMRGQADKKQNGWLFITSNEEHHESLKPLISMWLGIAANSLLAMGENRHRRVWFFYDELPSLHKLPTLPRIIAEARKFGGCFVLGFQSFAQLEETYGPKAAAGMFDLLNTKFFFRSPSADIAQFVEKDIGETRRLKFSEQTSFGHEQVRDGISFGKDEERVNIVSYSDVQSLNDLQCFVTLPGNYPVVKLSMKYTPMEKCAESLILRDLQTNLDPNIEDALTTAHSEERMRLDILFTPSSIVETLSVMNPQENPQENPPIAPVIESVDNSKTTLSSVKHGEDTNAGTQNGGVEKELKKSPPEIPPGLSAEGEIIDQKAFDAWQAQANRTQEGARREEVNINHAERELGDDESRFI